MSRTIITGEVRTGRRITQIPVSACRWKVAHRADGSIEVDIPLSAGAFSRLTRSWFGGLYPGDDVFPGLDTLPEEATPLWRPAEGLRPEFLAAVEPVRCYLGVMEGEHVLEAGPIWSWAFDHATSTLTVRAGGMMSLLDHRFVIGPSAIWAEWAQTYSGLSLGTIAKRTIEISEAWSGGELPIVLPADVAGEHERTFRGFELATVRQRITDLMGVIGGPDIALRPRLTEDRLALEWVLRVGDPLLHQDGADHVWDSSVPRGGVGGLSVARDASGVAGRAWVTGSGSDEALLMAQATDTTLTDHGFPLVESSSSRSTVEDQATLDSWALGAQRGAARAMQTWSAVVRADTYPKLGTYEPGDFARVWVPKSHPLLGLLLPEGFHRARIQSIAGDLSDSVTVEWTPSMEAR